MTVENAESDRGSRWRPQIKQWLSNGADNSPENAADLIVSLANGSCKRELGATLFASQAGKPFQLRLAEDTAKSLTKRLIKIIVSGIAGRLKNGS